MKILIINGPNLNLVGRREKEIYGTITFEGYLEDLRERFPDHEIEYFQSNIEGAIIDRLQSSVDEFDGIILNAGGYSHTSVALADAVKAIGTPVTEVHISNLSSREEYRHRSLITPHAKGMIMGFGLDSYQLALYDYVGISR